MKRSSPSYKGHLTTLQPARLAQPHDSLFLHCDSEQCLDHYRTGWRLTFLDSGHAGQEQYGDGDEGNDFDETLCPVA